MTVRDVLDNIVWHCLAGPHRAHSSGHALARRYAPGLAPVAALDDDALDDGRPLAPLFAPGETALLLDSGDVRIESPRWRHWLRVQEGRYRQMVAERHVPVRAGVAITRLEARHAGAMAALAAVASPGSPFGPRAIDLGRFYGVFYGDELVAMAGQRFHARGLREIASVSTHPLSRGRGYAAALVSRLVREMLGEGEQPFLHVAAGSAAQPLYERLGFRVRREMSLLALRRQA